MHSRVQNQSDYLKTQIIKQKHHLNRVEKRLPQLTSQTERIQTIFSSRQLVRQLSQQSIDRQSQKSLLEQAATQISALQKQLHQTEKAYQSLQSDYAKLEKQRSQSSTETKPI